MTDRETLVERLEAIAKLHDMSIEQPLMREAAARIRELEAQHATVVEAYNKACAYAETLEMALEEITEARGAWSNDHLTHASNCIEDMQRIARRALSTGAPEEEKAP